jgi:hypothetical protein
MGSAPIEAADFNARGELRRIDERNSAIAGRGGSGAIASAGPETEGSG